MKNKSNTICQLLKSNSITGYIMLMAMPILLITLISGCAVFRSHNIPPIEKWPPQSSNQKKSINVTIVGVKGALFARWQEQATKAFQDSNLFSIVKSNPKRETDFIAQVKIKHIMGGTFLNAGMRFLSGLTFFFIPTTAWDEFQVETTIFDANKKIIGTYEKSEKSTLWVQTLLLPLSPVMTVDLALNSTCYDIMRSTINDAVAQGVF